MEIGPYGGRIAKEKNVSIDILCVKGILKLTMLNVTTGQKKVMNNLKQSSGFNRLLVSNSHHT